MTELGTDERRWLDALRGADEPTAADHARVRALVVGSVATGSAVAASATAGKTFGAFGLVWKIGLAALSLGALAAGAVVLQSRSVAPTALVEPVRTKVAPVPTPLVEPDHAVPEATAPEPAASTPAAHPAKIAAADIEAELALLSQAQRALAAHRPDAALEALAKHGRLFPHGALQVERSGLRAVASCEAGSKSGTQLANRFLAANPGSPLAARVRAACLSR